MNSARQSLDRTVLTGASRRDALASLPGWHDVENRNAITRTFRFKTFDAAFRFMTLVAEEAERLDHHPEWFNVYNRVDVTLSTHDAGGVTAYDLALAAFMDAAASKPSQD